MRGRFLLDKKADSSMRETRKRWSDPALWGVFQVSSVDRAGTLH